ncbi:hypothetical protein SAMN04487969_115112 [Paenibacillus algorifonticola]|uniref:Protein kinase domain-containing protein n=1 Tax=Paenibacillus algorifonticola TaxID=684063 RepID=A0A1I2GE09_9BACL|nr:serine/threonine protein kinase [Paenibacillus algorifonticola]SFF14986.1 hypothetical protein SAMN04487969_115112 [Paenibacillus algorifonticola]
MEEKRLEKWIELTERTLLEGVKLQSINHGEPIQVDVLPEGWELLGAGNYAGVFVHRDAQDIAVKVYAPGREGWEAEREVYRRLGDHPAYSTCYHASKSNGLEYLMLRRLEGKTLYKCVLEGVIIEDRIIAEIDAALDYAREQGLFPHDVHGKNVMVSSDDRGLVVDVSDFLKEEPCMMWDDLKKAYNRIYMPFLSKHSMPVPEWVMNGVRKGYRWVRSSSR